MVGHLRAVKDPLLAAEASALLPSESRVRVVHIGACLEAQYEPLVRAQMQRNPRYVWLGPRSRSETLAQIARAHVLALTSRAEGGANVVAEALMAGTVVLATRIEGAVGQLGERYEGFFPVGDARALAELLLRCERDPTFFARLRDSCAQLRSQFDPARERESWRTLLRALAPA